MCQTQYTEKIILFMDILGFRNLVEQKSAEEIKSILKFIYKFLEDDPLPNYQISHFSDSVILSFELPKNENMAGLLSILRLLIVCLLQMHNILIRGGMCKGTIYHTNEMVFGPGVTQAYVMESKIAIFPRIIVDKCIVDAFHNWNNKADPQKGEAQLDDFFELDSDRNYIFNYLNCAEIDIYKETIKDYLSEKLHDTEDKKIKQKLNYVIKKLS